MKTIFSQSSYVGDLVMYLVTLACQSSSANVSSQGFVHVFSITLVLLVLNINVR